ncbi:hypothetical protein SLA2020_104260 [Shorea laevis]
MQSASFKEASQVCLPACCPSPFLSPLQHQQPQSKESKPRSTSAACRHDFAETTASSIFPNTQFTNHESLPSLEDSLTEFTKAYPRYSETHQVDQIRTQDYYHLTFSNHTCLDYLGIGLFSYSQLHESSKNLIASSSHSLPPSSPPQILDIPFFGLSCKTGNLKMQLLHGGEGSGLESAMKKRIMSFLNISENEYCMVFTANKTSAFKLLAESYPFQSNRRLLTVYDYESEAVDSMINCSAKKGAKIMSAEFSWPRLRIQSANLRKMVVGSRKKNKRGLFVFPLHSRMTGARYPFLWLNIAQENGWHVLVDACALGPKDTDSFGLSLLRPDFLVCSFYKVFGENPSGFGCLFVKKSTAQLLETSTSSGIVSLIPTERLFRSVDESSGTDNEVEMKSKSKSKEDELASPSIISDHLSVPAQSGRLERGQTYEIQHEEITAKLKELETAETLGSEKAIDNIQQGNLKLKESETLEMECRGLDQVDSLGLTLISNRARCLINWLVNALTKLKHPNTEGIPLVRIYGPKIKFDRGPALAFNVYDWKGDKVEPVLVQKLADRSNISLSYGFLHHIWFADKYQEEKNKVIERKSNEAKGTAGNKGKDKSGEGIHVVTAALGFLASFQDIYRLWAFIAQFLDADFVEKERWRYTALNQKTFEV